MKIVTNSLLTSLYSLIMLCPWHTIANSFIDRIQKNCWGHYQLYQGNHSFAFQLLNAAGHNAPQYEKFTLAGRVELLFETQQYKDIVTLYHQNRSLFDTKVSLKKTYALSLAKLEKTKESDAIFIELNKTYPTETEIAFYAVNAYINNKDLHNALNVTTILLAHNNHMHNTFIFYFLQAQIYLQMNDLEKAKIAVQTALKLNPDFDKGWLLFSVLAEQEKDFDQAIHGYNTFLSLQKSTASDYQIKKHILELALAQEKATKKSNGPNHLLNRFNETLTHTKNKNYNQALICIEHCIQQEPNNKIYSLLKIETLIHLKQYKKLADYCSFLINQYKTDSYWYNIVHYIARKEKLFIPHAILLLEKQITQDQITPLLYLADIYIQQKQWVNALQTLEQLSPHIQDSLLSCAVDHQCAVMHFMQKQYDRTAAALEKNLINHPHHIPSLNLLADVYITSKKFKKALKLIAKARAIDAKNPHLMDTHALLFYEQKQYAEAKELLNKALALAPTDATIILHLAQVTYK